MENQRIKIVVGPMVVACLMVGGPVLAHDKGDRGEHHMKMMDTNNDGKLSADEHSAGAQKMFEAMDANRDGQVTAAEMTAAKEKKMAAKQEKAGKGEMKMEGGKMEMSAAEKIKTIDTNNDGILTAAEHAAGSKTMFEKMDTNKDGFVTKDEMRAGHKMMYKPAE